MDTQRGSKSIHECCCSSIGEELGKCPFHSYKSLNSVSWLDLKSAVGNNEELKNVLNTNIPILSAETLFDLAVHAEHSKAFIPLVHIDNLAILDDRSGHSAWICNPDSESHRPTQSTKSEYHFFGGVPVKVKSYLDLLEPSTMIGNLLILNKSPYIPSHVCSIIAFTLLFISVPC
jgi:hypothetical protein